MLDGDSQPPAARGRRALIMLGAGALAGVVLAAHGVVRPVSEALPRGVIARVNDRVIRSDRYERAWRRVASDKRNPMGDADRARILRRLIEEELLIQRGEAIGLVESDSAVRKAISGAMIQSIVAESEAALPDTAALRAFYQQNRRYFAPPGTLHVRQIFFQRRPGEGVFDLRARARAARDAIGQGLAFADARERYGEVPVVEIPDAALPANKLRQYVGPTGVERVLALEPLEVSEPVESGAEIRLFQLVAATSAGSPPFEEVRDRVESAFRRDAGDRALRENLEWLWREADIVLAPGAPDALRQADRR